MLSDCNNHKAGPTRGEELRTSLSSPLVGSSDVEGDRKAMQDTDHNHDTHQSHTHTKATTHQSHTKAERERERGVAHKNVVGSRDVIEGDAHKVGCTRPRIAHNHVRRASEGYHVAGRRRAVGTGARLKDLGRGVVEEGISGHFTGVDHVVSGGTRGAALCRGA